MCQIVWHWDPETAELLLLSNRDEFYHRPTLALHHWPESGIFAGKDLQALGTWLGCTRTGRLAAVTNYRTGETAKPLAKSRGEQVIGFLKSTMRSETFLHALVPSADAYNAFNLLVFDGVTLCGFESHSGRIRHFSAGISGVSNAGFDTPWPKLERSKFRLGRLLEKRDPPDDALWALLADEQRASIHDLPKTGIPGEVEHPLSAVFVKMPGYGTRASSVVHIGPTGIRFQERTFNAQGLQGQVDLALTR